VAQLPFDTLRDFAPIHCVRYGAEYSPYQFGAPREDVERADCAGKQRSGRILYASIGPASPSHLTAELFNSVAAIKTTPVSYKGAAPSMVALVAGGTQLTFTTVLVAVP
jgi:tripartite-type tricarboxylate transporter receptor subunit TctC